MTQKSILVCGATGFIGRNLVRSLAQNPNYKIIALEHRRPGYEMRGVEWRKADLRNPDDCKKVLDGVDIVIQAAATTSGSKDIVNSPEIHITDNAVMSSYLFKEASKRCEQVIFFSCLIMYQSSDIPQKEEDFDPSQPLHSNYFGAAHTKLYLERMCEFFARHGSCKFTVIRHSNIYGPFDKFDLERSHVFGATITKVMTAKDEIVVWGTGEEARDFLFVDDLVEFVSLAMEKQKETFGLYNVGSGFACSIRDLVQKVIQKAHKNLNIRFDVEGPTINTRLCLDCSKAKDHFGWTPRTGLEEGIEKTLAWWRENYSPEKRK